MIAKSLIITAFLFPVAGMSSAPAFAQYNVPDFRAGLYDLRPVGKGDATQPRKPMCFNSSNALMQLAHKRSTGCRITSAQAQHPKWTTTYNCAAHGWGRTELRQETPDLYQIDTQGIKDSAPFAYRVEARRAGDCPEQASAAQPKSNNRR